MVIPLTASILQKEFLVLMEILDTVILDNMRLGVVFRAAAVLAIWEGADPRLLVCVQADVADKVGHAGALLVAVGAAEVRLVIFSQVLIEILGLMPDQLAVWKRAQQHDRFCRRCIWRRHGLWAEVC